MSQLGKRKPTAFDRANAKRVKREGDEEEEKKVKREVIDLSEEDEIQVRIKIASEQKKTHAVSFPHDRTIGDVRATLAAHFAVDAEVVDLYGRRLGVVYDDDDGLLRDAVDYVEGKPFVIEATVGIAVTIRHRVIDAEHEVFDLSIYRECSVFGLKRKISELRGIPALNQQLIYNGRAMLNHESLMRDCTVAHGDVIQLLDRPPAVRVGAARLISISIKTLTGATHEMEVDPDWTGVQFKDFNWFMLGVPADQQRLIFAGRQLEDNQRLREYGVEQGSVLHMILRLGGS